MNTVFFPATFWDGISRPFIDLWNRFVQTGPHYIVAAFILLAAWIISRIAKYIIKKTVGKTSTQGHVDILIARAVSGLILFIGLILALGEIGMSLTGLLAAVGMASLGIGFALQDILGNLFSGILLLIQHPFTIGDQVRIGNEEGVVENVRLRDTQIHTFEGERVFVPNLMVSRNPIINFTQTPTLRVDVKTGIRYEEDIEKARRMVKEVLATVKGVLQQPEPVVLFESDKDYLVLVARFWIESDRNRSLNIESEVLELVVKSFVNAGISIPYPYSVNEEKECGDGIDDTGLTTIMKSTIKPEKE